MTNNKSKTNIFYKKKKYVGYRMNEKKKLKFYLQYIYRLYIILYYILYYELIILNVCN